MNVPLEPAESRQCPTFRRGGRLAFLRFGRETRSDTGIHYKRPPVRWSMRQDSTQRFAALVGDLRHWRITRSNGLGFPGATA
jgi:hypothetical protein